MPRRFTRCVAASPCSALHARVSACTALRGLAAFKILEANIPR